MIQTVIEAIVSAMDANSDSFTFLHSAKDWQNLQADEITLPAVFMDFPVKGNPEFLPTGSIREVYEVVLFFCYGTNIDDSNTEVKTEVNKAHLARQQFLMLLNQDTDNVKDLIPGQWYEVEHLYDRDLSGVIQPIRVELRNTFDCE